MTTLIIQPGPGVGNDTLISMTSPDANYGAFGSWRFGANAAGTRRGLIQFDLSGLPADAVISSVTLEVVVALDLSDNARTVRIYRQKRAWVKGTGVGTATNDGATWNNYSYVSGAQAWQTAGGFGANDCEQSDIGTCSFSASESVGTVKTFALTPTTKAALDLGFGWLVMSDTEVLDLYGVYSSADATLSNRPKLTIVYTSGPVSVILSGGLSFSGGLVRQPNKVLSGSLTPAGALIKRPGKVLSGSLSFTGGISRAVSKVLSGSLSFSGGVVKQTSKILSGALSFLGSLIPSRTVKLDVTLSDAAVTTCTVSDSTL